MQPIFFVSYARLDNNKFSPLKKVVDALRERVRAKAGVADLADSVGFFDVQSISTGADWEKILAPAVSKLAVIVCFCSQTYFNSRYCANEFDAFRRRLDLAPEELRNRVPGPVIPALWDLAPNAPIPAAVRQFYQKGDIRFPKAYWSEGLRGLANAGVRGKQFDTAIGTLAQYIVDAAKQPDLPAMTPDARFEELAASFHNPKPGPYNLAVTVFEQAGVRWGALGVGSRLADAVDAVADQLSVGWREILADDDMATNAAEAAKSRAVHVFVVPEANITKPPWNQRLDELGHSAIGKGALLVVPEPTAGPIADAVARVLTAVPSLATRNFLMGQFDPNSPNELSLRLGDLANRLRFRLMEEDKPAKVESAAHAAAAKDSGIPIDARPVLTGPAQPQGQDQVGGQ
jgi:hypothetical protein